MALLGKFAGEKKKHQFLLDTGASCNFVSSKFLESIGRDWDLVVTQNVKLADGQLLKTKGTAQLTISFGRLSYCGTFYVL